MIPIPKRMEKNIIGSTSPLAREEIGLVGTIPKRRSATLIEEEPMVKGSTPVNSMPIPGLKRVPKTKPIIMAKRVVNIYRAIVLTPIEPSLLGSPIETTPATSEVNINGTTNILINLTNKSPIHFEDAARSPKIKPKMAPATNAIMTRAHNFRSVFAPK